MKNKLNIYWVRLNLAICTFFAFFAFCNEVLANVVRCPICNQVHDKTVKVCPNDGADLELTGKAVSEEGDTDKEDSGDKTEEKAKEKKDQEQEGVQRYMRHDQGGDRRRVDFEEDDEENRVLRTQRDKRFVDIRIKKKIDKKQTREVDDEMDEQAKQRFVQLDEQLKADYLRNREKVQMSLAQVSAFETNADKGRQDLRQKMLYTLGAPFISLGTRLSWMKSGNDPGPVTGFEVDINLVKTEFRMGFSSFIGMRSLPRKDEVVLLESISLGFQRPWRFSPFILGRAGIGAVLSHQFGDNVTFMLRSFSLEAGFDGRLSNGIVITPSIGYVRYAINNVGWDSVTMKVSVGF